MAAVRNSHDAEGSVLRRVLRAAHFTDIVRWSWNRGGVYSRGFHLFSRGLTEVDSVGPQHAVVRVMPQGKPIQTVEIVLDENGIGALCTCGRCGGDPCEHAIAASHALEGYLLAHPIRLWQDVLSQAIEARSRPLAARAPRVRHRGPGLSFPGSALLDPARVLPDELPEAPAELARFLYDVRLHRRAREVHSRSDFGGIRNACPIWLPRRRS